MDDSKQTSLAVLDRRLESLRHSILERPLPGINEAQIRANRTGRRRPLQVAVFVIGIAVLIAIPVIYEGGTSSPGTRPAQVGASAALSLSQKIERAAQKEGARLGDPVITSDRWVATDAASADRALGQAASSQGPAYLVEITGSFSAMAVGANGPAGPTLCIARPPTPFAYFVVNQMVVATGLLEVTARPIDLARLGKVHTESFAAPPGATAAGGAACSARDSVVLAQARAFMSLEAAGAESTFSVTYAIPVNKGRNDVPMELTVAHVASPTLSPPAAGTWMFEITGGANVYILSERPHQTSTCSRYATQTNWWCGQVDRGYPQGIGSLLTMSAYEPWSILQEVQGLGEGALGKAIVSFSQVAGQSVKCLTSAGTGIRACITFSGVLASFENASAYGSGFESGTATSISSTVPTSLLNLPAVPTHQETVGPAGLLYGQGS